MNKKPSYWLFFIGTILPIIFLFWDYFGSINQIIIPDTIDPTRLRIIYDSLIAFAAIVNAILWAILRYHQNLLNVYKFHHLIEFVSGLTVSILLFCGLSQLSGLPYLVFNAMFSLYDSFNQPPGFLRLLLASTLLSLLILFVLIVPYLMLVATILLRQFTRKKLEKMTEKKAVYFWIGVMLPILFISGYYLYLDFLSIHG